MVPRLTVPHQSLTQPFQRVRFGSRADRAIGGGHEARRPEHQGEDHMRKTFWMMAPAAITGILLIGAAGDAAPMGEEGSPSVARFAKIDPALLESSGQQGKFVPASLSDRAIHLVV